MSTFPCGHENTPANTDTFSAQCRACRIDRQARYSRTLKGRARNARYAASLKGRLRHNSYTARKRLEALNG